MILFYGAIEEEKLNQLYISSLSSVFNMEVKTIGGNNADFPISHMDKQLNEKINIDHYMDDNRYFMEFLYALDRESTYGIRMFHVDHLFKRHIKVVTDMIKLNEIDLIVFSNIPHQRWSIVVEYLSKIHKIDFISILPTVSKTIKSVSVANKKLEYKHISPGDYSYAKSEILYKKLQASLVKKNYYYLDSESRGKQIKRRVIAYAVYSKKLFKLLCGFYLLDKKNFIKHKDISYDFSNGSMRPVGKSVWINNLYEKAIRLENLKKKYSKISSNLVNKDYFLFPLHYQPEATTMPMGYGFHDQIYIAHIIASTLERYGVKLVVAEHSATFSINKRADRARFEGYYECINSHKNIILVKNGLVGKLINDSMCVISITGTAAFEKVLLDGRSIIFGSHFAENLKGVTRVRSIKALDSAIDSILKAENADISEKIPYLFDAENEDDVSRLTKSLLRWIE